MEQPKKSASRTAAGSAARPGTKTAARPAAKTGMRPAAGHTAAKGSVRKKKSGKKAQQEMMMKYAAAAVLLILIIVLCVSCGHKKKDAEADVTDTSVAAVPAFTPAPTPVPGPTAEPWTEYLPVITQGDPGGNLVAITVDDLNEVNYLNEIMDLAAQYGGKLTLFPIGNVIDKKPELQQALRRAYELGFEIENHSYSHSNLYSLSDEEMASEIYRQNMAVNSALGLEYEMHFYRMKGGNGENDPRSHMYLMQNGYKGIVDWTWSGTDATARASEKQLTGGMIYLFHAKYDDLKKLRTLIPYIASHGYRMVTLNELLGYEENAVAPLRADASSYSIPAPSPFTYNEVNYVSLGNRKYKQCYPVQLLQNRLKELNYLDASVLTDGDYGSTTKEAVLLFQQENGLGADGFAGVQTQTVLFSDAAKVHMGIAVTPMPTATPEPTAETEPAA